MTTYYVSSGLGNDNNAGTSASAPFATLQVAADHTHPGDTVLVMNGVIQNLKVIDPAYRSDAATGFVVDRIVLNDDMIGIYGGYSISIIMRVAGSGVR